jgi:hypothetical protein
MGRHEDTGLGRRKQIASKLGLQPASPGQFEGHCPVCGRPGFSIKRPDRADYLHIWTCAADRAERRCSRETIRAALLRQFPATWIGGYGLDCKHAADPEQAARLREAVDLILDWPGCEPSRMRLLLAAARGDEIPDDYSELAQFFRDIGIKKAHSYNLAREFCRPSDVPHPGGGSADAKS